MKVEAGPFFASDPVLTQTRVFNRFSPRLHHTFDGTMESKKFDFAKCIFSWNADFGTKKCFTVQKKNSIKRRTIQMKIMRYDNMPNGIATMKNTEHTKRWSRCEARLWGWVSPCTTTLENSLEFSVKITYTLVTGPYNPMPRYFPKRDEFIYPHKDLHKNAQSSFIHNTPKLQSIQNLPAIDWMSKSYLHKMEHYSAIKRNVLLIKTTPL